MATLEKVMQMRNRGMNDMQIIQSLQQEGINPKEINEALSQSKIKYALNEEPDIPEEDMQRSMISQQTTAEYPSDPSYPEYQPQEEIPSPQTNQVEYTPQYSPEYQQQYSEYQPQQSVDIETVNEIAEQVIEEKNEKLKKEISGFIKFQEEISYQIENLSQRLQKIESKFDELQMAILRKIGDYGKDVQNISKEMHATQESFSKILDPLTDNIRELQKITGHDSENPPTQEQQERPKRRSSEGFESFVR